MDNHRITAISQEILQACLAADDPVATLYAELDRLRGEGQWTELALRRLQVVLLNTANAIAANRRTEIDAPSNLNCRSEREVSEAIQECVRKCMEHDEPLDCVAAYITSLLAHRWLYEDAKAVERGALRVLAKIMGDDALWPND